MYIPCVYMYVCNYIFYIYSIYMYLLFTVQVLNITVIILVNNRSVNTIVC